MAVSARFSHAASEKVIELINGQAGLSNDRPQCSFRNLLAYGWWHWLTMGLQTFQVTGDRFFDIVDRFAATLPLRNAARKRRDFGDVDAIFILLNEDAISHSTYLPKSSLLKTWSWHHDVLDTTGFNGVRFCHYTRPRLSGIDVGFSRSKATVWQRVEIAAICRSVSCSVP